MLILPHTEWLYHGYDIYVNQHFFIISVSFSRSALGTTYYILHSKGTVAVCRFLEFSFFHILRNHMILLSTSLFNVLSLSGGESNDKIFDTKIKTRVEQTGRTHMVTTV